MIQWSQYSSHANRRSMTGVRVWIISPCYQPTSIPIWKQWPCPDKIASLLLGGSNAIDVLLYNAIVTGSSSPVSLLLGRGTDRIVTGKAYPYTGHRDTSRKRVGTPLDRSCSSSGSFDMSLDYSWRACFSAKTTVLLHLPCKLWSWW